MRPALPLLLPFAAVALLAASPEARPRIRDLAITDVEGVRVGHRALVRGESVRTGAGNRGEAIPIDRLRELLRGRMRP